MKCHGFCRTRLYKAAIICYLLSIIIVLSGCANSTSHAKDSNINVSPTPTDVLTETSEPLLDTSSEALEDTYNLYASAINSCVAVHNSVLQWYQNYGEGGVVVYYNGGGELSGSPRVQLDNLETKHDEIVDLRNSNYDFGSKINDLIESIDSNYESLYLTVRKPLTNFSYRKSLIDELSLDMRFLENSLS